MGMIPRMYEVPAGGKKTFIRFKIVPFKRFEGSVQMVYKFDSTVSKNMKKENVYGASFNVDLNSACSSGCPKSNYSIECEKQNLLKGRK